MGSKCDECRRSWRKVSAAPELYDKVWLQLADRQETLCFECMLARADKRGVDLDINSLKPCPANLFHTPQSWFDLFVSTADRCPMAWQSLMASRQCTRCQEWKLGTDFHLGAPPKSRDICRDCFGNWLDEQWALDQVKPRQA
jgi:hypothetical protein